MSSDPTGHSCNDLGYYLQYNPNSYDSNVQRLQHQLNAVSRAGLTEDGYFGGCTEAAVRNYQSAVGIGVDGVVGDETWGHLFGGSRGGESSSPAPAPAPTTNLQYGSSGSDVTQLQTDLKTLGYVGADGNALSTDGIFGANIDSAVRKFQSDYGLTIDGIVGPITLNSISAVLKQATQNTSFSKNPPPEESGYKSPKGGPVWDRVGGGWKDKWGDVWVPSPGGDGGDHWDVEYPDGGYDNVYPDGHRRAGSKGKGGKGRFAPIVPENPLEDWEPHQGYSPSPNSPFVPAPFPMPFPIPIF